MINTNKMQHYLFICAHGETRSKTSAEIFGKMFRERGLEIDTAYQGIDIMQDKIGDMQGYLGHFNRFFVMEQRMKDRLVKEYHINESRIECLDIHDFYEQPELVDMIRKWMNEWMER